MAGLDINSRDEVSRLLGELNEDGTRVVLVQRAKGADAMPSWVTDICEVKNGDVWVGPRAEWEQRAQRPAAHIEDVEELPEDTVAEPVVKLQDVSVSYGQGSRPVLKNISWEIQPGQRWHLQGANGEYHAGIH